MATAVVDETGRVVGLIHPAKAHGIVIEAKLETAPYDRMKAAENFGKLLEPMFAEPAAKKRQGD